MNDIKTSKPRLAENVGDLWKAVYELHQRTSDIFIVIPLIGRFQINSVGESHYRRCYEVNGIPVYEKASRTDMSDIESAFEKDCADIRLIGHGINTLLHSASGNSWGKNE